MLWVNVGKGAWAVNGKVVVIDSIDFDKVSTLAHFVNERIRRVDIDKLAPVRRAKSELIQFNLFFEIIFLLICKLN